VEIKQINTPTSPLKSKKPAEASFYLRIQVCAWNS